MSVAARREVPSRPPDGAAIAPIPTAIGGASAARAVQAGPVACRMKAVLSLPPEGGIVATRTVIGGASAARGAKAAARRTLTAEADGARAIGLRPRAANRPANRQGKGWRARLAWKLHANPRRVPGGADVPGSRAGGSSTARAAVRNRSVYAHRLCGTAAAAAIVGTLAGWTTAVESAGAALTAPRGWKASVERAEADQGRQWNRAAPAVAGDLAVRGVAATPVVAQDPAEARVAVKGRPAAGAAASFVPRKYRSSLGPARGVSAGWALFSFP